MSNDIPMHVIVNAGEIAYAKIDLSFIAAESFDEDVSIGSLIEDKDLEDILSLPTMAKERPELMSVATTEDEFDDDTSIEASVDCENGIHDVISFCDMDDCDDLSLSSQSVVGSPQELSYNVSDVTCPMCYSTADGGDAIVLPNCNHAVCISCFQVYIRATRTLSLPTCCPLKTTAACSQEMDKSLVQQIQSLQSVQEPGHSSDYHACPTLGCSNVVYWKEGNGPPIGDCFRCNTTSCLKCGVIPYHTHKTCSEYMESKRQAASLGGAYPLHTIVEERGESNSRRCSL